MPRILLINPRITSKARLPLAVMALAGALREAGHETRILDGNLEPDVPAKAAALAQAGEVDAVGVSCMGGPQLAPALAVSRALKTAAPHLPVAWGGYFPTLCPDAALAEPAVDCLVRGQGEAAMAQWLTALFDGGSLAGIDGLSWRDENGLVRHNPQRRFAAAGRPLDLDLIDDPGRYFSATYLGARTTGYQAALGCRYRCSFCGVAAAFKGKTALPPAERLDADLSMLRTHFGVDSVNYYDHNFFDREADMQPMLDVLARHALPWWCFARADALLNLGAASWAKVRASRLRMAYIGAESPNDAMLRDMRKGTRSDQTLAAVERCKAEGVVPELSFMLAPPQDPVGETERTFEFIRRIKRVHPDTEVMLYVHTPLPTQATGPGGLVYPRSAQAWTTPEWVSYWCHQDAPWLTPALRERIEDFRTVLGCRFPTRTDIRIKPWQRAALRGLASWRYRTRRYQRPWELRWAQRQVALWNPQQRGL